MGYSLLALKANILARYPEIIRHNILVGLELDEESRAYRITLRKDMQEASTVLSKMAADMLMCAGECPCVGTEIGRIIGDAAGTRETAGFGAHASGRAANTVD